MTGVGDRDVPEVSEASALRWQCPRVPLGETEGHAQRLWPSVAILADQHPAGPSCGPSLALTVVPSYMVRP